MDFALETWNNPRFQGGMQAFGGLTEAVIGGGMALGSGGIVAPVGGLVMTHGLDHFFTGLQTAFSRNPRNSVTNQLLQKTGMSSQTASLVDGGLSISGSMGGIAVIRASRLRTFPNFQLGITASLSSKLSENPLKNTRYTKKFLAQMEKNLKTGQTDFHGFPSIVDNYTGLGKKELIQGRDGLTRIRVTVEGAYKGQNGIFEWIIESNGSVNHRIFIPNP